MLARFHELVRQMTPEQLLRAKDILEELIDAAGHPADAEAPSGAERRQHQRFNVSLRGNMRSLIPGQRENQDKMMPISILDISREGLRFVVNTAEALYPIAEVTFNAPNGRIRSLYCRLVRTRLINGAPGEGDQNGSVRATEVAARAIDASELAGAQQRHRDLVAATKRIPAPEHLPIVLLGAEGVDRGKYEQMLQRKGYPLHVTADPEAVVELIESTGPQAVVYADAGTILLHAHVIDAVRLKAPEAAQIAVFKSNDDRKPLLSAGIDECVHNVNAKALLTMYLDRAVKARIIATVPGGMQQQVVLILADENLAMAQLGSRLNGDTFQVAFAHDVDGFLARLRCTDVDVALVDHGPASANDWRLVRAVHEEMVNLPLIVAVNDPRLGSEAILSGAADYLAMPFTVRNATQLITASLQAAECQMAIEAPQPPNFDAA